MSNEPINHWVAKAKEAPAAVPQGGVNVVRRDVAPTKGQTIMDIAEKLWPGLMEMLKGKRDKTGLLLQPAHIRGIALNIAQDLVSTREKKNTNA